MNRPDVFDTGDGGKGGAAVIGFDRYGGAIEDAVLAADLIVDGVFLEVGVGVGPGYVVVVLDDVRVWEDVGLTMACSG